MYCLPSTNESVYKIFQKQKYFIQSFACNNTLETKVMWFEYVFLDNIECNNRDIMSFAAHFEEICNLDTTLLYDVWSSLREFEHTGCCCK